MTKQQMAELKWVADNLRSMPVQAAARFELLVRELRPVDRHALADTLRDMIAEAQ